MNLEKYILNLLKIRPRSKKEIVDKVLQRGQVKEQADEVIATYRQWFNMQIAEEQEGWVLLAGTKI